VQVIHLTQPQLAGKMINRADPNLVGIKLSQVELSLYPCNWLHKIINTEYCISKMSTLEQCIIN
jgi:hypothetical protein